MAFVSIARLCVMETISVVMVQMRSAVVPQDLAQASFATKPSAYLFHGGVITSRTVTMVVMRRTALTLCKLLVFK